MPACCLTLWWSAFTVASFLGLALAVQQVVASPVRALVRRAGFWGERAVVLGEPGRVAAVEAHLAQNWHCGLRPEPVDGRAESGAPPVALIAGPPPTPDALARLRLNYADVVLLADLTGVRISGLRSADLRGELGVRLGANAGPDAGRRLNRIVDLAVAVPAAILLSPAILAAAAAIYATDPGPVIYRQTREGLGGRRFEVLKLRTMYLDADLRLEAMLRDDPAAQAEWSRHFKLRRDPRILPLIGRTSAVHEHRRAAAAFQRDRRGHADRRPAPVPALSSRGDGDQIPVQAMLGPTRPHRPLADLRAQRSRHRSPAAPGRILHRKPLRLA